jgi:hypothetical protein
MNCYRHVQGENNLSLQQEQQLNKYEIEFSFNLQIIQKNSEGKICTKEMG